MKTTYFISLVFLIFSCQSKMSKPEYPITEKKQVIIGRITQLSCLNIMNKIITKNTKIEIPKTFKSFFTKLTTSLAIIGIPPKYISP